MNTPIPVRKWHLKLALHPAANDGLPELPFFKRELIFESALDVELALGEALGHLTKARVYDSRKVLEERTGVQFDLLDPSPISPGPTE